MSLASKLLTFFNWLGRILFRWPKTQQLFHLFSFPRFGLSAANPDLHEVLSGHPPFPERQTIAVCDPAQNPCGICSFCRRIAEGRRTPRPPTHGGFDGMHLLRSGRRLPQSHGYHCKELASKYIAEFAGSAALTDLQEGALIRRFALSPTFIGIWRGDEFNLQFFFELFDSYLFCGTLRASAKVQWADFDPEKPGNRGNARDHPDGSGVVLISIVRPVEELFHSRLGTLLHEMVHATFRGLACRCDSCSCKVDSALSRGLPNHGHGPYWRQLAEAVEKEADRSFVGFAGSWSLNCHRSGHPYRAELAELQVMDRRGELADLREEDRILIGLL